MIMIKVVTFPNLSNQLVADLHIDEYTQNPMRTAVSAQALCRLW
jgi:hypothetical protein